MSWHPARTASGRLATAVVALPLAVSALGCLSGCSHGRLPEPEDALRAYREAAQRGDGDALYALMTEGSRRTYGRAGVQRMVLDQREELRRHAERLGAPHRIEATAQVRFADGEVAELALEDGEFRVGSAGTLPTEARSPGEALGQLRQALARRSYPALLRVLSGEARNGLENELRALVTGLERPEALEVESTGDQAQVQVPGGHRVKLKREEGVWRVLAIE